MKQKISFKELAKKSGVSVGTLSRYFNDGSISPSKKAIISSNIKKFGFIKNAAAGKMRKKVGTIIIRTFYRSLTQDNMISGIIETLKKDDITVKYANKTQKEVIKAIKWSVEQNPVNLVIFAPVDADHYFEETLKEIHSLTNVVVYDYNSDYVSTVVFSLEKSLMMLRKKHSEVNFIFDNIDDKKTYANRLKVLKKTFKKVNVGSTIFKNNNLTFFQTESLRRVILTKDISNIKNVRSVSISYDEPIFLDKSKNIWIFVDSFMIGVIIAKMTMEKSISSKVLYTEII